MRQAASIEDFLAAPDDRWVRGARWLFFFSAGAPLYGTILVGRPDESDMLELRRCYPTADRLAIDRPYPSLFDASLMDGLDAGAFRVMADYFTTNADAHAQLVTRVAIVHGPGLAGATVAGFARVVGLRAPAQLFTTRDAALAWLACDARGLGAELAELTDVLVRQDPLLARLRGLLAMHLADAALPRMARALGVSERTLQRGLQTAGTTFHAELARARVEAASRLLIETDDKLSSIAMAVGCASPQHFSDMFRKETGVSPSEWRRRRGLH